MMDGDTIGSEERIEVAGEEEIKDVFGASAEELEDWKYSKGLKFLTPGSSDMVIRAHGQNVDHYAVHYSENFFNTATRHKDGSIESHAPVTGWIDCMQHFEVPQLREAIRNHHFEDKFAEDKKPGVVPFTSNIIIDYVNEFDQAMRKTFVNGRFTNVESDIELHDIVLVDRYFFEADDVKIEVFHKGENGWEVAASSKTSMKVGVIGG